MSFLSHSKQPFNDARKQSTLSAVLPTSSPSAFVFSSSLLLLLLPVSFRTIIYHRLPQTVETGSNSTEVKPGGGGSLQPVGESYGQRRGQSRLRASVWVAEASTGREHGKALLTTLVDIREGCESAKSVWKSFYTCMWVWVSVCKYVPIKKPGILEY